MKWCCHACRCVTRRPWTACFSKSRTAMRVKVRLPSRWNSRAMRMLTRRSMRCFAVAELVAIRMPPSSSDTLMLRTPKHLRAIITHFLLKAVIGCPVNSSTAQRKATRLYTISFKDAKVMQRKHVQRTMSSVTPVSGRKFASSDSHNCTMDSIATTGVTTPTHVQTSFFIRSIAQRFTVQKGAKSLIIIKTTPAITPVSTRSQKDGRPPAQAATMAKTRPSNSNQR
mmetsp:Transcript_70459/g.165246  ORF Transcript_70459/g.165246 Transcript_70459/m.165246 type:complete len:226 (-) Transcript_70459:940-1617(-)